MTAQEVVTYAMMELGVISPGEQPTAEEGELGRQRLNWLLKSWQAKGANLWRDTTGDITIPADSPSGTLSPNIIDVQAVRVINNGIELPIARWEEGEYRQIPNKASPGRPTAYYLDKQRDAPVLYVWPVPATDTDLKIDYTRVIEDVTALTETLDVPQQWTEAVWVCLAARLIPNFGIARIDPTTAQLITQRAVILEQEMLDSDRPASIFMGPIYGRGF